MQLSVLHTMINKSFPGTNATVTAVSRLIRDVFPNVRIKRHGKERKSLLVGIELKRHLSFSHSTASSPISPGTSSSPTFPGMASSLTSPVTESFPTSPGTSSPPAFPGTSSSLSEGTQNTELLLELQFERDRRVALEWEVDMLRKKVQEGTKVQTASVYQQHLCSEIDSAVCSSQMLRHGPDTVQHFSEFSMSNVITELQASCPLLYKLVQQLGSTQRNARHGALSDEELKGVMAICTLLNARSARVKGVQLMISLMLVARAAGRQVYTYTQ